MTADLKEIRARMENAVRVIRQQQARIEALEAARAEPIAIVGLGCRFPGGADTPDAFWTLLRDGVDAVGEVPPGRWDVDAYYDSDRDAAGKMYTRHGAFLDAIDQFDPTFFGISPREAEDLDPQQRLLLEVTWETLEHAAVPPDSLRGSRTGVFVGSMSNDYSATTMVAGPAELIGPYTGTGAAGSFLAGRLSYQFGWQGPSMPVDAACASSLVAVHLACNSLRNGECDLALAGGANVILSPRLSILISRLGALSADGRCKTFDASADGFGRGEGCGMVALKRLSDAQAQGDRILAVVRGSAVNHNGASSGITVPNPQAQQAVIRQALEHAGLAPEAIDYVEAHGTGTILGDPAELRALWTVLGEGVTRRRELVVGAVKTNIGHTEGAAGIAGLIKVVLALGHGEIPPHLHLRELNPHIVDDGLPIRIPVEAEAWPVSDQPRRAGVSSFGLSGINAHVIVEEAPLASPDTQPESATGRRLLLSARTRPALLELAGRYAVWIADHPEASLADICHTAATGRARFEECLSIAAETQAQTLRLLSAVAAGEAPAGAEFFSAHEDTWEPPPGRRIALPTYPFQRSRYWHDDGAIGTAASRLREPREIVAAMAQAAETADANPVAEGMAQVEGLALDYLVWGLARLGWRPVQGERLTVRGLAAQLGVVPRYERLLGRFLAILEEEGRATRNGDGWRVDMPPGADDPKPLREHVARQFPHTDIELVLLERCGTHLPEVLRGTVDPLGLIFPTDGAPGAVELYHRSLPLAMLNRLCGEALALAIADLPVGQTLRILEIGAGTGGTTHHLLPQLPAGQTEFCYTDLSAAFFAAARERFAAYPFVDYRVLDAESDPERQGFTPHQFDIVVAANVLHATRDLPRTLDHVRRLLAPRGMLLLFEGITRRRSLDLTFGLLEGWWRFDDSARKDYPMLDLGQWGQLLQDAGFEAPSSVTPPELLSSAAVILARLPASATPHISQPAASRPAVPARTGTALTSRFGADLDSAAETEREPLVIEILQVEVARLLGLPEDARPAPERELFSLGFDSLMALELSQRTNTLLPLDRPFEAAVIFEKPTIAALAKHLLTLIPGMGSQPTTDQVDRDWNAEATLDAAIRAPDGYQAAWSIPRAPLLTGATGFLGAFLLHQLLTQTDATVHCLVRCKDAADGLARLCDNLRDFDLFDPAFPSRITAVPGNLGAPRLGLDETAFERLAATIDAIYHSGAAVNFLYGYDALRASNVDGTREILRLACLGDVKPVHHVSTLYVLHIFDGPLLESALPERLDTLGYFDDISFAVGYAQSKAVAELLVREAGRRGIPVTIYRPGFLAGDSQSGAWSVRDFPARLIKAWTELGVATAAQLNVTPADYIGRGIVRLSLEPASAGRTFHMATPRSISGAEMVEMFAAAGLPLRLIPYDEWKQTLAERVLGESDASLVGLLEMMPASQPKILETAMQIDSHDATDQLVPAGITCPVIDTALMRRYLDYFARIGFIDKRLRDVQQGDE